MDGVRYQSESPLARHLGMMADHHRHISHDPAQFWTAKTIALPRFKRHSATSKKKSKDKKSERLDALTYTECSKDKYGSLSAHSTSAIYGALRAPYYQAVYGPSNVWYSSVRSLTRAFPRDVVYPAEGYEWREPLYEEAFPRNPKYEAPSSAPCSCKIRRPIRAAHGEHVKSRQISRCTNCTNKFLVNGSLNEESCVNKKVSSSKAKYSLSGDIPPQKPQSTCRMSGYKKCVTGATKYKHFDCNSKDQIAISRKSILECEVTAYDLLKNPKPPSIHENGESDIDDNLSENVLNRNNQPRWLKNKSKVGSSRHIANKLSLKFNKSQSHNNFNEFRNDSVDRHRTPPDQRSKSPVSFMSDYAHPRDLNIKKWHDPSNSNQLIDIPDPDYDFSDDSDKDTIVSCRYRDPKLTYSPPSSRKSSSPYSLGNREISKSMSSLVSDDTYVPSDNEYHYTTSGKTNPSFEPDCDTQSEMLSNVQKLAEEDNIYEDMRKEEFSVLTDPIFESSSSCSSSAGTLSSEYPTWTSSSSNELKSILKNKRNKRSKSAQPTQGSSRDIFGLVDAGEIQRKKQVQFLTGGDKFFANASHVETVPCDSEETHNNEITGGPSDQMCSVIACNAYEPVQDSQSVKISDFDKGIMKENPPDAPTPEHTDVSSERLRVLAPKHPLGMSSSLEDIREIDAPLITTHSKMNLRSTIPKRKLTNLNKILCLKPSSFCGEDSSSDDLSSGGQIQRGHRSLPDSPSEIEEVPSFCFDLFDKSSKEKVSSSSRSVFYVPIDNQVPSNENTENVVAPSTYVIRNETRASNNALYPSDMDENISMDDDDEVLENEYEHVDPIYEDILDLPSSEKRVGSRAKSFFEGASRIEILTYLEDAKERGLSAGIEEEEEKPLNIEEEDSTEKDHVNKNNSFNKKTVLLKIEEVNEKEEDSLELGKTEEDTSKVERNDSGVGAETSKPPRLKSSEEWGELLCADCDLPVEAREDEHSGLLEVPLACRKCEVRRAERKETIIEFVDTELKYGRDLRIVKEEFYRPMEIAGLLAKDQLLSIFLNLDELILANMKLSEKLSDALDIALEHGDEDYTTVNIGKLFIETSSMLHAFETYCVKQAPASLMLSSLEKDKELLRIFLRVSQMENTLLRRMNLPAFLMVPVQRVTRYPLLLSRLHKVTPIHHKDRLALKEAQQKVELHLEHINQQTKGVGGTKIWRRISNISSSHRRLGKDIGNIKLRKMALESLSWTQDETNFVMLGKLLVAPTPSSDKKGRVKYAPAQALLIALGRPNANYRPDSPDVLFPRNTGIRNATLVLMKEKNSNFTPLREPLFLGNCIICCDSETDDVFEIQEYTTKDAFLLKGETRNDTRVWFQMLRYHAKDLGLWRKRRNALPNIMMSNMIRQ